jgi:hypothetical protein
MTAREERIKLTVEIPKPLWKRVKVRAIEEEREVWRIVTEALEAYLAKAEKKGGAK